jgi:putative transposase
MLFIKVYIHFVWKTKNKLSFLASKEIRKTIWNHIRETANKKGIRVDFINGYSDHYRCLIALDQEQSIEKMFEILKGERTFWINKKGVSTESFLLELPPIIDVGATNKSELQENYFTILIGESELSKVNNYIQEHNQDKKKSSQEYDEFLIEYGFKKFNEKIKSNFSDINL